MHYRTAACHHAARAYPAESCGLLLESAGQLVYQPERNIAPEPRQGFRIPPASLLRNRHCLRGVIHSHPHPHGDAPSRADLAAQAAMRLPWAIIPVAADGLAGVPAWFGGQP